MRTPTLKQHAEAIQGLAEGEAYLGALITGTGWEKDPRVQVYLAALRGLDDVLWEVHQQAEQQEGLCDVCREEAPH